MLLDCTQVKHEMLSAVPKDDPVRATLEKGLENFENPFVSFNTETKSEIFQPEMGGCGACRKKC